MPQLSRHEPLYDALDFAMVRAPLLAVETYLSLGSREDLIALLRNPPVKRAIAAGSVSLLNALDRFEQSSLSPKDIDRMITSLLRYAIRMSTRPTPYGLFAGCSVAPFGEATDLNIRRTFGHSVTRPDMVWLMNLVTAAESDSAIRQRLRLFTNPLTRFVGDRIALDARMPPGAPGRPVSARATNIVLRTLELARQGVEYYELARELLEASVTATPEKVDQLLTQLWEQTFLLTDLRPPLTIESPSHYVLWKLKNIPEATEVVRRLESFLAACSEWDSAPHEESVAAYRKLLKQADAPEDGSKQAPVQVDLALCTEGALGTVIAKEAVRAAELLLRLSPFPRGSGSIEAYRNAFVRRYGTDREVPLMELLDSDRGLGPVSAYRHAFTGPDPAKAALRNHTLLSLACAALHNRSRAVTLHESDILRLETWQPDAATAPPSLDINLLVAARSAQAIDAGDFTIVLGPNLGAWACGRNFGRFAHLYPYPSEFGKDILCKAARVEQSRHFPDAICAEISYLPSNVRSANVTIRPAVRSHELLLGVSPGVAASNVIPVDGLVVGVQNQRFYIYWPATGKRVRFASGHMLVHNGAPPVVQFLSEAAYEGAVSFTSFDWGPAESFPFLPRIEIGRLALRPAEWKIAGESLRANDYAAFQEWRGEWDVPRYVSLAYGDNRLVLDLELKDHVNQILAEAAKLSEGRPLVLQEVFPALDEVWLTGEQGHYYSELIVPLVLRPNSAKTEEASERTPVLTETGSAIGTRPTGAVRLRPPGSEWLYFKLHCPQDREDELIANYLPAFTANAIASDLADSWFFIRYNDPDRHIRLRFHGAPAQLSGYLFGHACQWANDMVEDGICTRFVFDTYDREIERFGGLEGMALSEGVFHADSVAAMELVGILNSKAWKDTEHRTALLALSVDDLLADTGMGRPLRGAWYKTQAADTRENGQEYRRLKNVLRAALGDTVDWLAGVPCGVRIAECLRRRRDMLSERAKKLEELTDAKILSQSLTTLCSSYAHLHLNRLGAASEEKMLLELLSRAWASLLKAPVR
jgi:lantibiotic biosynthesis protein